MLSDFSQQNTVILFKTEKLPLLWINYALRNGHDQLNMTKKQLQSTGDLEGTYGTAANASGMVFSKHAISKY